ncbi:MAG: sulfatase [Pirellulales bacterium]
MKATWFIALIVITQLLIGSLQADGADRPNILFLLSDDHSAPYLGCLGYPALRTPALDKLAKEGILYDRFFTSCPQCVPSRAALMTGRSPVALRMVRFTSPLPGDIPALPDLLRDKAGYFTGIAGRSYHLDGPATNAQKNAAPVMGEVMDRMNLRTFKERADYVEKAGGMTNFGGKLEKFLDQVPANKPWFFWLGFSDPHHVWETVSSKGKIDPAKISLPAHLPDLPGVREDLAAYLQEVEHLDEDVDSVLKILEKHGLANNTLVIFLGDNGMAMPHGKGYLTDPGINTPCIVRWPGVTKPGQVAHNLLSGEDFTPTMMEIAGIEPLKEMSGISFAKQLRGQQFQPRKYVFAERGPHGGDGGMKPDVGANTFDLARCVRSDNFKLIYNCTPHGAVRPVDSANNQSWKQMEAANAAGKLSDEFVRAYFTSPRKTFELYNLQNDPAELNNLAGDPQYRDVELDLKRALTEKMVLDWDFLPAPLR